MSFVESIMGSIASNFGNREGIELGLDDISIYDISINGTEVPFNPLSSSLKIDSNGDADLELKIFKKVIMEKLLDEEDMVKHLKDIGYNVTWWRGED